MTRNLELAFNKHLSIEVMGILYFVVVVIAGVSLVYQPAKIAYLSQETAKLNAQLYDLKLRNENLKQMVASMESLTSIEVMARDELGMVDPEYVRSVAVSVPEQEYIVSADKEEVLAAAPAEGIYGWLSRIAQFMKDNIAVAKGRK